MFTSVSLEYFKSEWKNNVFSKWKIKRKKSDIDVSNNSWRIIGQTKLPSKGKLVGIIGDS